MPENVEQYKALAPLCDDHDDYNGGCRSGCVICSLIEYHEALSKVCFILQGEPNPFGYSKFDASANPKDVIELAKKRMKGEQ